jgi:transposase
MSRITVFSQPERRRSWSEEEQLRVLTDAFAPKARVADGYQRYDATSLIFTGAASGASP